MYAGLHHQPKQDYERDRYYNNDESQDNQQKYHIKYAKVLRKNEQAVPANGEPSEVGDHYHTIDRDHVMHQKRAFPLNLTTPHNQTHYPNFDERTFEEITPFWRINSTNVTIWDVLRKNDKLLVGHNTFTKKCDSEEHCFVAKCKPKREWDGDSKRCQIYKDTDEEYKKAHYRREDS